MSQAERGFTLMEVIVAMAILSVSAVLLLESHYASLELTADAQTLATGNRLLEAAASFAQIEVIAGETSGGGDFGELYPGFAYSFRASEVKDEDRSGLYTVDLSFTTPTDILEQTFFVYVDALANDDSLSRN